MFPVSPSFTCESTKWLFGNCCPVVFNKLSMMLFPVCVWLNVFFFFVLTLWESISSRLILNSKAHFDTQEFFIHSLYTLLIVVDKSFSTDACCITNSQCRCLFIIISKSRGICVLNQFTVEQQQQQERWERTQTSLKNIHIKRPWRMYRSRDSTCFFKNPKIFFSWNAQQQQQAKNLFRDSSYSLDRISNFLASYHLISDQIELVSVLWHN